jgi:hypothetical protein
MQMYVGTGTVIDSKRLTQAQEAPVFFYGYWTGLLDNP